MDNISENPPQSDPRGLSGEKSVREKVTLEDVNAEIGKPHSSLNFLKAENPEDISTFASGFVEYLMKGEEVLIDDRDFSWKTIVRVWSHVEIPSGNLFPDIDTKRKFASALVNTYIASKLPDEFQDLAQHYLTRPNELKTTEYWGSTENLKLYGQQLDNIRESVGDLNEFLSGVRESKRVETKEEVEAFKAQQKRLLEAGGTEAGKLAASALETFNNALSPIFLSNQIAAMRFERLKPKQE